jgi:hypothetical protein
MGNANTEDVDLRVKIFAPVLACSAIGFLIAQLILRVASLCSLFHSWLFFGGGGLLQKTLS